MKNIYKVKLVKWSELKDLEENINKIIEEMQEENFNLKDIKDFNHTKYNWYTFILIFYKLN